MYKNEMYHVAYRVLENRQNAEDAVHEAFVKLIDLMHRVDDPRSARTRGFVLTITEARAIDMWRKLNRLVVTPLEERFGMPPADIEGKNAVLSAIAALPGEHRRALLLRYDTGMTADEIARIMGKSVDAVYKTIERAKTRLAQELRKEGVEID